jgi:hypothetical protein
VAACSQGDGVEVNGLRKRTAAAHSEVEVESVACPGVSDEATTCSRARLRMTGGGGGTMVSRVTIERERVQG